MEKTTMETVIALVLGVILGVLAASSFWFLKNHKFTLSLPTNKVINIKTTTTPTPLKEKLFSLEISSPSDLSIVNTATPNLSGKSSPNTLIIISLTNGDEVLRTDAEGNFQKLINLNEGLNYISVTAISAIGQTEQVNLAVVYETK
ncbi:hypothetical protein HY030_00800 [Candidatus Gottesmanbacteria bacterium]|nr:hypothetical protein [Candidatus Gottesmanbacteria bacterium]